MIRGESSFISICLFNLLCRHIWLQFSMNSLTSNEFIDRLRMDSLTSDELTTDELIDFRWTDFWWVHWRQIFSSISDIFIDFRCIYRLQINSMMVSDVLWIHWHQIKESWAARWSKQSPYKANDASWRSRWNYFWMTWLNEIPRDFRFAYRLWRFLVFDKVTPLGETEGRIDPSRDTKVYPVSSVCLL